jgi:methyl-galactoside transport system permease protein
MIKNKINELKAKDKKTLLLDNGIYIVLMLLLLIIIAQEPSFVSIRNFKNILTQSSVRMIIALGVGGIIVTRGTDLSAGRQVGLAAVISATLLQALGNPSKAFPGLEPLPLPVVILIVVIIGAVLGLLNGWVVSVLQVTPFIATLGMMIIVYGINSLYFDYVGATPIASFAEKYTKFAQGSIQLGGLNIPYLIIYAVIAIILVWTLWNKTIFGKNMFAIGGNPEAAEVSGVNVTRYMMRVYILSGVFYAFGGFLEAGRIGSATNNLGNMYELDAIAACVVGGVSFSGGVGSIGGVVMGVLTFTVINYGLTYIGVNPYWQYIIKGLIILMAVAMDMMKYRKKK